jgi:argininosuccinate synthase
MANKKVVVAFSGGLDTSYTVMKLTQDGWDVYAACANTGGFSAEQLKTNEENAYKLGAKAYVTLDVTHEYYEKSLKYMIFGNVLRNNCYPISVSSERIFQAIAIALESMVLCQWYKKVRFALSFAFYKRFVRPKDN